MKTKVTHSIDLSIDLLATLLNVPLDSKLYYTGEYGPLEIDDPLVIQWETEHDTEAGKVEVKQKGDIGMCVVCRHKGGTLCYNCNYDKFEPKQAPSLCGVCGRKHSCSIHCYIQQPINKCTKYVYNHEKDCFEEETK